MEGIVTHFSQNEETFIFIRPYTLSKLNVEEVESSMKSFCTCEVSIPPLMHAPMHCMGAELQQRRVAGAQVFHPNGSSPNCFLRKPQNPQPHKLNKSARQFSSTLPRCHFHVPRGWNAREKIGQPSPSISPSHTHALLRWQSINSISQVKSTKVRRNVSKILLISAASTYWCKNCTWRVAVFW